MSYSVPQAVDALGPLTALALGAIVWLMLIGTPVLMVLAIRFLWYRHVYIGKSKELEKLIWQLHRVASALEAQQTPAQQQPAPLEQQQPKAVAMSMFGR
jgi:hypothetical protein